MASLMFMNWLGIEVEFSCITYQRNVPMNPRMILNVNHIESVLNYSFKDPSLVVEALTHGSYMLPEIPLCYQVSQTCDFLFLVCFLSLNRLIHYSIFMGPCDLAVKLDD